VAAERAGFDDALLAEHHFMSYGICPSAVTLAAYVLDATWRVAVGTEARMPATYPEVFSRAWADHEAMLASLDDLTSAAGRVRERVLAKHHASV
jgi:alkanesulfonate monooxygenase SsuD/methylene tetrahydromethanopterin reductase-like flavin-dependent oxidoreductase (luciferase family)